MISIKFEKYTNMFSNYFPVIFSVIFLIYEAQAKTEIPSFIQICHRSDPNFSQCLIQSVDMLRPWLKQGIPELDIPSIEPLVIPELIVDQGTGAVNIKSKYRDIKVYGPSNFVLKSVKVDFNKDRARIRLWIPELQMESNYSMEGRIMLMPISGSGRNVGNFSNIEATATMQAERIDRDDDQYYHIKDFYLQFQIGNASIQLNDLFGGDRLLGSAMNVFLNSNWDAILKDLQPVLEDQLANMFKIIANKIYEKFSIKDLFPL